MGAQEKAIWAQAFFPCAPCRCRWNLVASARCAEGLSALACTLAAAFIATQEETDEVDVEQIVDLEEEILEVIKDSSGECVPEHIMERTVELAVSSGEAGSSGLGVDDTTSAAVTAGGKSVGEARPPGIAKHSASTESVLEVSSVEAGSFGPGANDTISVSTAAVAKSVEGPRPPGIAKYSAARAATAVTTTVAKSVGVGEARPPAFANTGPRQDPNSQSLLVSFPKWGLLVPDQMARPAQPQQS